MVVACGALLATTGTGLAQSATATAATPCAGAILSDWYLDGRIDRLYALPCYEQAIDAVPSEIRDYTDAQEVISRAFHAASGRPITARTTQGPVAPAPPPTRVPVVVTSAPNSIPIPLLVLASLAVTMLLAGALGYVVRRRRSLDRS